MSPTWMLIIAQREKKDMRTWGIILQPSNSSCWICDSIWNANSSCVCSEMKIHRISCKTGDRKSRNSKMLISVEMQTGVYYKIWQDWNEVFQIWLQCWITAKTERKDHREQHEKDDYVHRAPPIGHEYAVQCWTLGTWNTGDQAVCVCYTVQYKYDASSHGNTHFVYGQKRQLSAEATVINAVFAGTSAINWNVNIHAAKY